MVGVISHKKISHRSLGRRGFESRMRIDDAGGSIEPGIRDAPDPRVPVVVGHVLEQPVDGVVEIAGVVDVLFRFLVVDMRSHLDERAFRHVAAAHVLIHKNISRSVKLGRRAQRLAILIHAIRPHAVRSADDQERIRLRAVFGHINRREQVHAIAHGNSVLILRVVLLDAELRRLGVARGGSIGAGGQLHRKHENQKQKKDERKQTGQTTTLHLRAP